MKKDTGCGAKRHPALRGWMLDVHCKGLPYFHTDVIMMGAIFALPHCGMSLRSICSLFYKLLMEKEKFENGRIC